MANFGGISFQRKWCAQVWHNLQDITWKGPKSLTSCEIPLLKTNVLSLHVSNFWIFCGGSNRAKPMCFRLNAPPKVVLRCYTKTMRISTLLNRIFSNPQHDYLFGSSAVGTADWDLKTTATTWNCLGFSCWIPPSGHLATFHGGTPRIIHFGWGFSLISHPFGVPPFSETSILVRMIIQ